MTAHKFGLQLEFTSQNYHFSDNKRQDSYSSFENNSQSAYEAHNNGGSTSGNNRRSFDHMGSEMGVRKHVSDNQMSSILDRRHLEDVTNHQQQQQQQSASNSWPPRENQALIIDDELNKLDPVRLLSIHTPLNFAKIINNVLDAITLP